MWNATELTRHIYPTHWKFEYPQHIGIVLSVDVLVLAVHIYSSLRKQEELLSIMLA